MPFVQMLSTTNTTSMWSEFATERAATLAALPATVDPDVIVQYDKQMASQSSSSSDASVLGAVASDPSSDDSSSTDSWGKKYGMIALGLLAGNLLVGLVLLAVTLTMCVRGVKGKSGPRYAPVRFKEAGDDYERSAMKYSD